MEISLKITRAETIETNIECKNLISTVQYLKLNFNDTRPFKYLKIKLGYNNTPSNETPCNEFSFLTENKNGIF